MASINEEWWIRENTKLRDRIYYLEAILRDIQLYSMDPWAQEQASQAKVTLEWTENYGQGSEPWLKEEE